MKVPFLDLKAHHEPFRRELLTAIEQVMDTCDFTSGKFVETFEAEFAEYSGTRFASGVGSGTEAIWLALLALGVGPGDEVITVPNTFAGTIEAIHFTGATPVLVDVDDQTYNMDPALVSSAISPRTKAIVPVHLFGRPADMDPILKIAKERGLKVVADAAQAQGALYKGRPVGILGDAVCFSFYPGKNLGAFGDAGAVVTTNRELDEKIKILRNHGQDRKNHHVVVGWNGRMDGLQAAVLSVKLKRLGRMNQEREALARYYHETLKEVEDVILPVADGSVQHIYAIRTPMRDSLIQFLDTCDISCGIHYPAPVHLQPGFDHLGYGPGSFPVAERVCQELISLPLYPELTFPQIDFVVSRIKWFFEQLKKKAEQPCVSTP